MRCVALRSIPFRCMCVFVRGGHVCRPADRFWLCVVRAVCGTYGTCGFGGVVCEAYIHA